jgi:glycosyltransferase involved in cell wall biosynthesis
MPILELSKKESRLGSKTFKVGMIPTMVCGQSYYRMASFCWKMRQHPKVEAVCSPFAFDHLEENPWERDYISNTDVVYKHLNDICEKSDVVVWQTLHYKHTLEFFEEMRMRHQKPFLVETDDYLFDIPSTNAAFESWRPGSAIRKVALSQIRQADGLIVSTPYLAEMYRSENATIHVVPNSIDFNEWKDLGERQHNRLRIGWVGGATHSSDLEMIASPLSHILRKYENVWFYCIHGVPNSFKTWNKTYWTTRWAPINLYPKFVSSFKFDIGIAPLEDNNFNRGKSNLRWLEYSALKIPTIASSLPDFMRVIEQGKTGFIARDEKDWIEYLSLLIEIPGLRRDIGRNAFDQIKRDFNVAKTARTYLQILREVAQ